MLLIVRSFCLGLLLMGLLGFALSPVSTAQEKEAAAKGKVELTTIKYDDLPAAIPALRGKVVGVDIWASWCIPCKKEFPHLVDLHKKYAKDGLVCVSVSVDDAEEGAPAALKFLQKQNATFTNYRIFESDDVWQPRWRFKGPPAVFVFDRQGRRAGKFTNDDPDEQFSYEKDV